MGERSVLLLVLFTLFCDKSISAVYPRVPCPDVFRYVRDFDFDFDRDFGLITLENLNYGDIELEVELSQPGAVYPGAEGYLNLNIDEDKISEYIRSGSPITYKVIFPLRNIIPQVSSIKLNGNTICYGPRVSGSSTTTTLRHSLTTSGSSNILPLSFDGRRSWRNAPTFRNQYPSVPCPDVFQYVRVNGIDMGLITIHDVDYGETRLDIELSQPGSIPPDAEGHLRLNIDDDKLLDYIRTRRPITFRVTFPLANVVPQISYITVNGFTICFGPRMRPPSSKLLLSSTFIVPPPFKDKDSRRQTYTQSLSTPWETLSNYSRPRFGDANFYSPNPPFTQRNEIDPYEFGKLFFDDDFQLQPNVEPQTTTKRSYELWDDPPVTSPTTPITTPTTTTTPTTIKPITEGPVSLQYINSVCGLENLNFTANKLAVNGRKIPRARFPWIVAIYKKTAEALSFQCGGSLISTRTVISAAHCFYADYGVIANENILISLGRHNLTDWTDSYIMQSDVETIIRHPDYRPELTNIDADLAVVRLRIAVKFSQAIRPVCLWQGPLSVREIDGISGIVVGWGRDENNSNVTTTPRLITASVASEMKCIRSNDKLFYLTSNRTLCAGNRDGTGPCNGDSGSGLMLRNRNKWMIRGTVSAALGTPLNQCNLDEYVVYTDIAKFIGWIQENMLL